MKSLCASLSCNTTWEYAKAYPFTDRQTESEFGTLVPSAPMANMLAFQDKERQRHSEDITKRKALKLRKKTKKRKSEADYGAGAF